MKIDNKISEGKKVLKLAFIGGFAHVYKVTDVNTFATYALKKIYMVVSHRYLNKIRVVNLNQLLKMRLEYG